MPFEALKFIHATGLLVDHQVRDVGMVSDKARPLIVDASLQSLERLVEVAVEQSVDFVLLTGDTFCEQDRSLRARVAIVDALQCMDEAGIQVFVVPGPEDPADAWHAITRLPDNVTVFDPVRDEPTAVMRDGQVIATLQGCPVWSNAKPPVRQAESQTMGQTRLGPLRVGIVPPQADHGSQPDEATVERWLEWHRVDYLALPRPFHRLRVLRPEQVAFCPGSAVPVTRRETGVRGAALVSAEGRGAVNLSLFPTSPLRRETFNLVLDESTSWDQLISVMHSAIQKLNGLSRTRVLLANWHFEGSGEVLASLHDEESKTELFELLAADDASQQNTLIEHRLGLQNRDEAASALDGSRHYADSEPAGDADETVSGGFRRRLDRAESIVGEVVRRLRQSDGDAPAPWTRRVEALGSRVDSAAASTIARHLADQWFAGETAAGTSVLTKPKVSVGAAGLRGTAERNPVEETLDAINETLSELEESHRSEASRGVAEASSLADFQTGRSDGDTAGDYTEADAFYDNEAALYSDDDEVDDFEPTGF
jgi:exonuclease SbcD